MDLVSLVKHYEGFAKLATLKPVPTAVPYLCPAGYWTRGYGSLCKPDSPSITEPEACVLLDKDLSRSRTQVLALTKPLLPPNKVDALTSFVFNLGSGRYRGSTLRAVINRGEFDKVPGEMLRWVYGGGQRLRGLELRREAEVVMWLG
jgi:lysozyme